MTVVPIAVNTVRDLIRRKLVWCVLLMVLVVGGCTTMALHNMEEVRSVAIDERELAGQVEQMRESMILMTLGGMELCAMVLALILGSTALPVEIESRTAHTVLAKGVSRPAFVIGKFLGTCVVLTAFLALATPVVLWGLGEAELSIDRRLQIGLALSWLNAFIWMSMAFAASTVLGTFPSATLTIALLIPAWWAGTVRPESPWWMVARAVDWPLPEWSMIQGIAVAARRSVLEGASELWGLLHALDYVVLMLLLAIALFRRRELG